MRVQYLRKSFPTSLFIPVVSAGHTKHPVIQASFGKKYLLFFTAVSTLKEKEKSTKKIIFPFILFILVFMHISGTNTQNEQMRTKH